MYDLFFALYSRDGKCFVYALAVALCAIFSHIYWDQIPHNCSRLLFKKFCTRWALHLIFIFILKESERKKKKSSSKLWLGKKVEWIVLQCNRCNVARVNGKRRRIRDLFFFLLMNKSPPKFHLSNKYGSSSFSLFSTEICALHAHTRERKKEVPHFL